VDVELVKKFGDETLLHRDLPILGAEFEKVKQKLEVQQKMTKMYCLILPFRRCRKVFKIGKRASLKVNYIKKKFKRVL
jgi:hypothetical protein